MEPVSTRRGYTPFDTLLAAAPIGHLRLATLSDAAKETLLHQAQERLAQLQGEWRAYCVPIPNPIAIRLRYKIFQFVGYGSTALAAASVVWPGPSLRSTGILGVAGGAGLFLLQNENRKMRRVQPIVDDSFVRWSGSGRCLRLKDSIADAEAVIAELSAGQKKTPVPVAFTPTVPAFTPSAIAKASLVVAIGGGLVYAFKSAAAGFAGLATCLTPRSVLENLGSEQSDFL